MGIAARVAWHGRAAWRASRVAILGFGAVAVLLPSIMPVKDAWLAAAVAATAALLALGFLVLAESRRLPLPGVKDPDAALEKMGTPDLLGLVLARAALVLGAFALGLWVGTLLPLPDLGAA